MNCHKVWTKYVGEVLLQVFVEAIDVRTERLPLVFLPYPNLNGFDIYGRTSLLPPRLYGSPCPANKCRLTVQGLMEELVSR